MRPDRLERSPRASECTVGRMREHVREGVGAVGVEEVRPEVLGQRRDLARSRRARGTPRAASRTSLIRARSPAGDGLRCVASGIASMRDGCGVLRVQERHLAVAGDRRGAARPRRRGRTSRRTSCSRAGRARRRGWAAARPRSEPPTSEHCVAEDLAPPVPCLGRRGCQLGLDRVGVDDVDRASAR